jgi:hypothetical protein
VAEQTYLREQAWDYFSLHASQRMSIFNFYIVLSSVIVTSYCATFKVESELTMARCALAASVCLLAFIFWKLDQRNKALIKLAERALKYFESIESSPDNAKLFTVEEAESGPLRFKGWKRLKVWRNHLTYSECFNFVFIVFFLQVSLV